MIAENDTTEARVMAEALTWVGTPYHNHACAKGIGVDCAMLLVGIARALRIIPRDWTPDFYTPQWHLHQTEELYCRILEMQGARRLSLNDQHSGHIVLFRWRSEQPASHAAILMPEHTIIHARSTHNPTQAVVRHELFPDFYRQRLAYVYAWPEAA